MTFLFDPAEKPLERWLSKHGLPSYRHQQIHKWLFARRAESFGEMTDLPRSLRDALDNDLPIWSTQIVKRHRADDATEKLLLELSDGQRIECVLMREGPRRTICVSTQVGCSMGCTFCASGLEGVSRNLVTGEIVEQMLRLAHLLGEEERISHVVVMGMGEPLANLKALLPALEEATSPEGLGVSARRITISTVGLPPGIDRLARNNVPYRLAVSLHAPNDTLRNQLVRVNAKIGINAILAAAGRYFAATGRRLTFEYVLLADVNDQPEHAQELAQQLAGRTALLNVIPYNPVAGLPYRRPTDEVLNRFVSIVRGENIEVQVRKRKGDAIDAACGQLRRSMGNTVELPTGGISDGV